MREVPLSPFKGEGPNIGPDNPVCATCKHGAAATSRGCARVGYTSAEKAYWWDAWVTDFERHDPRCLCLDPIHTPQLDLFTVDQ